MANAAQAFNGSVNEQLSSDDRALTRLTKVLQILEANAGESQDDAQVEKWCRALVQLRDAEVKARIDASYASDLLKPKDTSLSLSNGEAVAEKKALQDELQTLRSEVASVAEMVVNYELQEPILQHRKKTTSSKADTQKMWLEYVRSILGT